MSEARCLMTGGAGWRSDDFFAGKEARLLSPMKQAFHQPTIRHRKSFESKS